MATITDAPRNACNILVLSPQPFDDPRVFEALQAVYAVAVIQPPLNTLDHLERALAQYPAQVMLCDLDMSTLDPIAVMVRAMAVQPLVPLIAIAENPTVNQAVDVMRLGAGACVAKADSARLTVFIQQVLDGATRKPRQLESHDEWADIRAQFEDFLNMTGVALMSVSVVSRRLLFVSEQFEAIFGYPAQRFVEDPHFYKSVVHPDDLERAMIAQQTALREGMVEFEHRVVHPNGNVRWVLRRVWVNYDVQGRPIRVNDYARDITKRKLAENSLLQNEQRLRSLFSNIEDVIWSANYPELHIQYLNTAARTLYGYEEREFYADLGLWVKVVHPDDQARVLALYDQLLSTGAHSTEYRIIRADGSVRWVQDRAWTVKDKQGLITHLEGIITDITERKEAEEAVRQSETRLRGLIGSQTSYMVRTDLEGHHTYGNQKFADDFGWLYPNGLFGGYALDSICAHHHERTRATVEACIMQPGKIIKVELDKPRADGGIRTTLWEFVCLTDSEGNPQEMQCMGIDISDRKQAELALQEANAQLEQRVRQRTLELEHIKDRLEAILNHSGDGIVLLHVTDGIQQGNDAFHTMFGTDSQSCFRQPLQTFFELDDRDRITETLAEVLTMGQTRQLIARACCQNGGYRTFEMSIAPVNRADKTVQHLVCILRDVTERQQMQDRLLASEERYRLTVTAMSEGLLVWDEHKTILFCNEAAERITGLSIAQMTLITPIDPRWHMTYADGTRASTEIFAKIMHQVQTEQDSNIVVNIHKPDGTSTWVLVHSRMLLADENQLLTIITTFTDITDIKNAEQVLQAALEKEKELGNLKSRFVSMASHEFRTPLAAILATTETLGIYRARMTDAQIDARLDKIRVQVRHMKAVMDDVLQLARVQADRMDFHPALGDVKALCREIAEDFEAQAEYQGRIVTDCPLQAVEASFDARLMRSVIGNVLHNALKYSAPSQPVYIRLTDDGERITLVIADNGIGIPPQDLKHLFDPFHRAANVGTISGTGLGLSIAKNAVDAHHGTIQVQSEVNRGTTVTITLPKGFVEG